MQAFSPHIASTPLAAHTLAWQGFVLHHERHRGFTAHPHRHPHGQLLVPLAGRMRLLAQGEDHALQPEWAAWVGPEVSHAVTPLGGELAFVAIDAPAGWLAEARAAQGAVGGCPPVLVTRTPGLWLAGRLLADELAGEAAGRDAVVASSMATMATLLARASAPAAAPSAAAGPQDIAVWRTVDAILQGYAGPVSVEEQASRAGLGVRQLERRFKAVVGVSPKQHVIAVRLAAAQAMLLETPATVAEVAAATGFASAAHLTAAFTRRVGAPPAAWRAASARGPGA